MSEARFVCAHCGRQIKDQDPMMLATDSKPKQVVIHTHCRIAFEEAKA